MAWADGNALNSTNLNTKSGLVFNVKDAAYGAKGDGVTDDRTAIQAAITAAVASGGGVVYFPTGVYPVSFSGTYDYGALGFGSHDYGLSIPASSNLTFRGEGRSISVVKKTTSGGTRLADYTLFLSPVLVGEQNSWVVFEDLGLDGAQTGANTPFTSGDEHLLYLPQSTFFVMHRCRLMNNRGGGLHLFRSYFVNLDTVYFASLDLAGVQNALTLAGGVTFVTGRLLGGHSIHGCTFSGNGQVGIAVGGFASSLELDGVRITNCTFFSDPNTTPSSLGIELLDNGGADQLKWTTIANCHFDGGSGIVFAGTDTTVSNCTFRTMNRATTDGVAINVNNANTVRGKIEHCAIDTATDQGILLDGSDMHVVGCRITGCSVGIETKAAAARAHLLDNVLVGNTTAIVDAGSGTVRRGNRLSTGTRAGQVTLSGGTATVSTAEVLASDSIQLTRVAAGGTLGHLSVGTIVAGTSFVVNSSSGTDTSIIFWEIVH